MKPLMFVAVVAVAISAGVADAQAQTETDRALGAGSYLNPNGPETGAWTTVASGHHHANAARE